ncbi:MAG: hypothetical protein ABI120_16730 [Gemmatimonadaceae bacterium]
MCREWHRTIVAVSVLFLTAACGGGLQPAPTPTPAPPTPAPVTPIVVEPTAERWTMPAAIPSTKYLNEVSTTLERDSAGRVLTEHVMMRGVITLQGRRDTLGAFRGSGSVDSFTVRGLEGAAAVRQDETVSSTTVPVLVPPALTVMFDALLDRRILRVAVRPSLPNECDRQETGATSLVRDLIVRLPRTLTVGATWRDSTVSFLCRLSVPITTRSNSVFIIERADNVQGGRVELVLRKTSDIQMAGELRSTWRVLTVNAFGRSSQIIRVDAASGVVRSTDSDGLLTVKLNDTSRRDGQGTQEVRQITKGRVTFVQ